MQNLELAPNNLSQINNGAFVEKCDKINSVIQAATIVTTTFSAFTTKFNELLVKLKAALVATRGNSYTQQAQEIDKLRDQVHSAFIHILKAYRLGLNTEKRTAAEKLYFVAKQFGTTSLRTSSYDNQTSLTEGMIAALRSGDYTAELTLLPDVASWVDDIETTNNNFKAVDQSKLEEEGKRLNFLVSDIRKEIMPIYNNLMNTCLGMANAEIDPGYTTFIEKINVINNN